MNGYSIALIPASWAFGIWHKKLKSIFAFGPLRFIIHRGLGEWKPDAPTVHVLPPTNNRGHWLSGTSPSERITRTQGPEPLAGGALEPKSYPRERDGFNGGARSGELGFDG